MLNPNWEAACVLLDTPTLRHRVGSYVDTETQRIHSSILDVPWSSGERRMISLALSLTSRDYSVNLYDAFDNLDEANTRRVVRALTIAAHGIYQPAELLR